MTYKEATHSTIMKLYKEKGAAQALAVADGILHSSEFHDDIEFKRDLHGEVCETVLEILLRDHAKRFHKDWLFAKSLVLFERGRSIQDFLTEIDFALFTREAVFLFECKSYAGQKVLVGNGKLIRDQGNGFDVYKQSMLHKRTIEKWLDGFELKGKVPIVQICMFNFSNGDLLDKRSRSAKLEMPCLNADNVIKYISSFTEPVWDMDFLSQAVPKLLKASSKLHGKHLQYVKSLHGNHN